MMTRHDKAIVMDLCNYEVRTIDPEHIKIKSMGKKHDYIITLDNRGLAISCTCPDHQYRLIECKHILYVNKLVS